MISESDDLRDLLRIMAEAKEEVERWDDWMKNQEPEPGDSSRKWLDTARREQEYRKRIIALNKKQDGLKEIGL